ncbi:hypothetical protein Tco_0951719 [Tanacetum coccineum]|uniref:Uncharacterized protein n=1 Tax=Tanacetum coccineum TaxID=301880 RepID=A0ABQ5E0Y7_9ASTR
MGAREGGRERTRERGRERGGWGRGEGAGGGRAEGRGERGGGRESGVGAGSGGGGTRGGGARGSLIEEFDYSFCELILFLERERGGVTGLPRTADSRYGYLRSMCGDGCHDVYGERREWIGDEKGDEGGSERGRDGDHWEREGGMKRVKEEGGGRERNCALPERRMREEEGEGVGEGEEGEVWERIEGSSGWEGRRGGEREGESEERGERDELRYEISCPVVDVAHRKRGKYMAKCAAIGYEFLSFSFSSLGEVEADTVTLLKRIRKFSMALDIETCVVVHIFNRISFGIGKEVRPR